MAEDELTVTEAPQVEAPSPGKRAVKVEAPATAEALMREAADLLEKRKGPRPVRYRQMAYVLRNMATELERIR